MKLELENELKALSEFAKTNSHLRDNAVDLFRQLNIADPSGLFGKFLNDGYFDFQEDSTIGTKENPFWGPGHRESARIYSISGIGLNYLESLLNEKKKEVLLEQQIVSGITTNQSVVSTNEAVTKSITNQRKTGRITLFVAIAAVIISLVTLLKDLWKSDRTLLEVPPTIDSIWQSTSQEIRNVNQSLQRIDSSVKSLKDSSVKK